MAVPSIVTIAATVSARKNPITVLPPCTIPENTLSTSIGHVPGLRVGSPVGVAVDPSNITAIHGPG